MGKLWHSNKEEKKHAVLSAKEKKHAKHAKKEVHVAVQWNNRDLPASKQH